MYNKKINDKIDKNWKKLNHMKCTHFRDSNEISLLLDCMKPVSAKISV